MKKLIALITILLISSPVWAKGSGTTAARTLTQPDGARPAALAESFTAMTNDITALGYNPASLDSLSSSQASFLYQKGMMEDTYGNILFGAPLKKGTLGVSVGYYDGGKLDYYNPNNGTTSSITAKKDMTAALAYGFRINKLSLGVAGKYITSELVEQSKASAFAGDLGAQYGLMENLTLGAALQNVGTKMTYINESEDLPSVFRVGAVWSLLFSRAKLNLLADLPYDIPAEALRPTVGVETVIGPLALRAGYQSNNDLENLSFGVGFLLGKFSIDYSYALVKDLDAQQIMSLTYKFGAEEKDSPKESSAPKTDNSSLKFSNRPNSSEVK